MPYKIVKHGSCYSVVNKSNGKVHSKCSTEKNAKRQMRLLYGVDHGMIPRGSKSRKSPRMVAAQR